MLVGLAAWRDRVREAVAARQIRLTDAIDAEVGPVAAPVVTKRLWGPWQIRIAVPFTRPARLGKLNAIVQRTLPERYQLVLTPQEAVSGPALDRAPERNRFGLRDNGGDARSASPCPIRLPKTRSMAMG
jgi:hypothetical protein